MPHKHTNTIGEDITSLSRVINAMNTDKDDQIWTHIPKYFKNVSSSSTFNMHVHVISSLIYQAIGVAIRSIPCNE